MRERGSIISKIRTSKGREDGEKKKESGEIRKKKREEKEEKESQIQTSKGKEKLRERERESWMRY